MHKSIFYLTYIFVVLVMFSNVSAQNLDIENKQIGSTQEYSKDAITIGPNVIIEAAGIVNIHTNSLAIKPKFNIVAGGQLHVISGTITGLEQETDVTAPSDFKLSQNFPNPFNPKTTIEFSLPEFTNVKIDIFNVLGQHIATLLDEGRQAGIHTVSFNAGSYSSGIYLYSIRAGTFTKVMKMMLVK